MDDQVCVIIAARDSAGTIATAIRSALEQAQVGRVVVVDDGSRDDTSRVATAAAAGDPRYDLVRCESSRGPAAARNLAIGRSQESLIAILDADDYLLPGRFERLLAVTGWDMIADNVAFVQQSGVSVDPTGDGSPFVMEPAAFVRGNISRAGVARGEYGFLKPVVRREFLHRFDLRYDESIRLGEDYDLYMRMLLAGGRFLVVNNCGYCALVRPDSLSGQHRTSDLERLMQVDIDLLKRPDLETGVAAALVDHLDQSCAKFHHRRFLDRRRSHGLLSALRELGADVRLWRSVLTAIARDKLASVTGRSGNPSAPQVRYLLGRTG